MSFQGLIIMLKKTQNAKNRIFTLCIPIELLLSTNYCLFECLYMHCGNFSTSQRPHSHSSNYPFLFWPLVTSNFAAINIIEKNKTDKKQNPEGGEVGGSPIPGLPRKKYHPPACSYGSEEKFRCFCWAHNSFKINTFF